MSHGYLALVLHAHLPFVRHPEDPTVMEEAWLYEAITETYLPLLRVFEGLATDGVPFRPLFVGVTWPSEWSAPLVSIANKMNDADELGMTWVSRVVRDVLVPLKRAHSIPLILAGHSLGARLMTRAVFGMPQLVDINLNRFLDVLQAGRNGRRVLQV